MQYHWINKENNDNLIIFFCGWSFDFKPFERLDCENNDVIVVYDYSDIADVFHNKTKNILSGNKDYKNYRLITWSMGVYTAYLLKDFIPDFDCKIAINGTPYPVNDDFGIPIKTFDLTLKYVETGLQGKFQKNLFKRAEDFEEYLKNPVQRTIENQKNELEALNKFIKNHNINYEKFYDYAIISDTDKIIPSRNQINCWQKSDTPIVSLDNGHFPFMEFKSWEDIINKCKRL